MKVRANKDIWPFITAHKEYWVRDIKEYKSDFAQYEKQYEIMQDTGYRGYVHHSHFTVIEEQKPEITVGLKIANGLCKMEVDPSGASRIILVADKLYSNLEEAIQDIERMNKDKITVGSEWVSINASREVATVKYVGDSNIFIKWRGGGEGIDSFLAHFKPKPKTVTMYFYKLGTQLCACEVKPASTPILFTKEIEL